MIVRPNGSAPGSADGVKAKESNAACAGAALGRLTQRVGHRLSGSRVLAWVVLGASAFVVFYRAITDLVISVGEGEPVGYLILLPAWVWAIAHRSYVRHSHRPDIADGEVDWIVGLVLGVFIISCQQLAAPRLADAAALWHFDLVALIGWTVACAIALFGLRAVARAWPAWLFVLACFPSLKLLIGTALGGDAVAYGILAVVYGTAALFLAVDLSWPRRLALTAASLVLGAAFVFALEGTPASVQQILPAACVPTVLYFVSVPLARTRNWFAAARHHPQLPRIGLKKLAALALLTVVAVIFVDDSRLGELDSSDAVVSSGWTERVVLPHPYRWRAGDTYPWAVRSFGHGATLQRFFIDHDATATDPAGVSAAVDVISVEQPGRLRTYPSGLLYPAQPPVRYLDEPVELPHGVEALIQYNSAESGQTPHDPLWVMLTWNWKLAGQLHQRVTVIVSQQPSEPDLLPTPKQPTVTDGVVQPLQWLMQTSSDQTSILLPAAIDNAKKIATTLIESASHATSAQVGREDTA